MTNYRKMDPREFLSEVRATILELHAAHKKLTEMWSEEPEGIDLNDIIAQDYPFKESFDELYLAVSDWKNTAFSNLTKELEKRNPIYIAINKMTKGLNLEEFVALVVECGGTEDDAIRYFQSYSIIPKNIV